APAASVGAQGRRNTQARNGVVRGGRRSRQAEGARALSERDDEPRRSQTRRIALSKTLRGLPSPRLDRSRRRSPPPCPDQQVAGLSAQRDPRSEQERRFAIYRLPGNDEGGTNFHGRSRRRDGDEHHAPRSGRQAANPAPRRYR